MSKMRLLERLSVLEDPRLYEGRPPDRHLRDSIVAYLGHLLNTRAGSVPVDPDYGMPDMSNIAGSFAMGTTEALSEAILRQVARYETRLRQPRISVEEETRDVITLRFELSGQIAAGNDGSDSLQPFAMIIRISAGGRVSVEPKARR